MSAAWRRVGRRTLSTDARTLAQRLLGWRLVRVLDDGRRLSGIIVEAEAYLGVNDRASHAFAGRRTPRNQSMYARPGTAYVYFTYGMHHCFNIVCARAGEPAAVLVRALEPVEGQDEMARRRPGARRPRDLCSGPAKLCQALAIDRALDGVDLIQSCTLFLERPARKPDHAPALARGPRIGIDYAGRWARSPLRWWLKGNPNVSR